MAGRDPNEAFRNDAEGIRDALHCVTQVRLILRTPRELQLNTPYSIEFNDLDPVKLKGEHGLGLRVGQVVRIVEISPDDLLNRFQVSTVEYFYELSSEDQEILGFHWVPNTEGKDAVTFPHLHVGRALVGEQRLIRPDDFHNLHIPTGRVSLESVLRLAIMEFQVQPLRRNWDEILRRTGRVDENQSMQ